jgi:outer membrane receptor for ferrienterochelin and colicins
VAEARSIWAFVFGAALASILPAAFARAQSNSAAPPTATAVPANDPAVTSGPGDTPSQEVSADDIDSLLDAADKDISTLGNVNVAGGVSDLSDVNPVVEGVSKKAETLEESPGIVDVITARDIEQFGAKNLYEVLQRATSTFMTGSFLFRRNIASIRGDLQNHQNNHVLVLINGRPFRDVTLGGVNVSVYTAFPIQTIERVEVIRGPGSVLYGTNAFNGVINIVTKIPHEPTGSASTLNGSHGWQSYGVDGGSGDEQGHVYAGATYFRERGWPFTATEDLVAPAPLDSQTAPWGEDNIGAFASYQQGHFTANLFAARSTQEMLGPNGAWPSDRLDDPRVFCDLGYLLELGEFHRLQTNFTYNYDGVQFPSVVPGFAFGTRSNSYLLESTYHAELSEDWNFMFGGLVDFHEGIATTVPLSDPIPQYSEIWYGVYMQLEYQALEWLKLVGGMQANLPGEIKSGMVPRFGAIAELSPHWTAKFLYGQAFRSPYQNERSVFIPGLLFGNPGLSPETIQTFDCQLAYRNERFRLAATYFHSDYFDIVTRVSFPQTYVNLGSMTFDGVELENDWELSERWRCMGSMTYQTNLRNGVRDTTSVPNWMAKLGVDYNTPNGWNVGLFDSFFGDQTVPTTAVPVNPDPQAYHLVSLNTTLDLARRLDWENSRQVQLQFLVQNLFDERIDHVEFERELINSLPAAPGRTYYGGLTFGY